jgi:thiamine-phosphate pyrophosphorylase
LNDRVDIALAARADGVHLGHNDLPPAEARRILGPKAIIGFSTHSVRDAESALALPIDYLALGPIFATSTKDDPDPVVGTARLSEAAGLVNRLPLVAIGGIAQDNARSVLDAGADSLAIIAALKSDPDAITARMQSFNAI